MLLPSSPASRSHALNTCTNGSCAYNIICIAGFMKYSFLHNQIFRIITHCNTIAVLNSSCLFKSCKTILRICFVFVCVWQEPFSTVDESNLIPFVLLKPVPRCAKSFPITINENMQKGEIGQDETEAGKENTSTQNQENAHFSRGLCRCLCSSLCLSFRKMSLWSVQKVYVGLYCTNCTCTQKSVCKDAKSRL